MMLYCQGFLSYRRLTLQTLIYHMYTCILLSQHNIIIMCMGHAIIILQKCSFGSIIKRVHVHYRYFYSNFFSQPSQNSPILLIICVHVCYVITQARRFVFVHCHSHRHKQILPYLLQSQEEYLIVPVHFLCCQMM